MSNGGIPMSRQQILRDPATVWPALHQFLAAYFHQDWVVEHAHWEEVVDQYREQSPAALVADTAVQLRALLAARLDDGELATVLDRLGGAVIPAAFGMTGSAWLAAVLRRLAPEA